MTEILSMPIPRLAPIGLRPAERIEQPEVNGSEPDRWTRVKQGVGRVALGLVMATGIYAGGSAAEVATGTEARAEAYTVNAAERAWCRWPSRFALCNRASQLGDKAATAAIKVKKDKGWGIEDGGADAVRHCYWNALMAKEFGRSTASGFAWRHEYDKNYGTQESNMDLHNNLKGRDWANAKDPLKRCIEGVNKKQLIRIKF